MLLQLVFSFLPFHIAFTYPTFSFFFFNDTATTEIYTLSLHDALPICSGNPRFEAATPPAITRWAGKFLDRKSTRLNSSHLGISYAVFCLKKKNSHNCRAGRPSRASRSPPNTLARSAC